MDFIWALALSSHLGMAGDYNEIHPHVRFIEDEYIAGAYHNSVDNISLYAGKRFEMGSSIGIELAAVTGYELEYPVTPYVRGTYDLGDFRLFVAPSGEQIDGETNIGVVLGIELRFN